MRNLSIPPTEGPGSGDQTTSQVGSDLYIDAENLQNDGQDLVEALISNWPDTVPGLSRLTLYVRADWVEMWKLWATSRFPDLHVTVRGVQHFSFGSSKNSADIAIATAAVADLLLGRISHVVVMSDDRDFISLYLAIRDELDASEDSAGKVPFLWVITSRKHSVSETAKQFFPPALLHILPVDSGLAESPDAPAVDISTDSSIRQKEVDDIWLSCRRPQQGHRGNCQERVRDYSHLVEAHFHRGENTSRTKESHHTSGRPWNECGLGCTDLDSPSCGVPGGWE